MVTRQFKTAVILNYANLVFSFAYTMLVTPLLIRGLGKQEFGLFCLIGAAAGYLSLFEFGMGGAIVRYVAKYNAENDTLRRERFLSTALMLYAVSSVLILAGGTVLATQLPNIFSASLPDATSVIKARTMLAIVVLGAAACSITNMFLGVLSGCEEFVFPRVVSIVFWCVRIASTVTVLAICPTAVAITALTVGLTVVSGLVNTAYALVKCSVRIRVQLWQAKLAREILQFSFYVFLLQVMGVLYWKSGEVIIGIKISSAAVAVYSVGVQLNVLATLFSNSINNLLLPHATQLAIGNASTQATTRFVVKVGRIILMLYGGVFLGFVFFGKLFISLWAGEGFEKAYYVTLIALSAGAVPRIQSGMNNVMKAKGLHGFAAIVYVLSAAFAMALAWILAEPFGLLGIASATAVGLVVGNVLIANVYYVRRVGFDLRMFCRETFSRTAPVLGIACIAGFGASKIRGGSIGTLLIQSVSFACVYGVAVLALGMTRSERAWLGAAAKQVATTLKAARGKG